MTRGNNRQQSGAFKVRRNRSLGAFRRLRVSFVRPRTVGFVGECPLIGSEQERRIEIRWPDAASDNAVRVEIVHASLMPTCV